MAMMEIGNSALAKLKPNQIDYCQKDVELIKGNVTRLAQVSETLLGQGITVSDGTMMEACAKATLEYCACLNLQELSQQSYLDQVMANKVLLSLWLLLIALLILLVFQITSRKLKERREKGETLPTHEVKSEATNACLCHEEDKAEGQAPPSLSQDPTLNCDSGPQVEVVFSGLCAP